MNVLKSEDELSYKFQHDNMSETTIKLISGCTDYEDESKFTVFISTSVGCQIGCKFCYLNYSNLKFKQLDDTIITSNTLEAIKYVINENPHLKEKYIKLSWMGMGDALTHFVNIELSSTAILDELLENKLVKGLDCVDISSTFPSNFIKPELIRMLKSVLLKYPRNPKRDSPLRMFFSLISCNMATRKKVIPLSYDNGYDPFLVLLDYKKYIPIFFHNILLEGINNNELDIIYTIDVLNEDFKDCELRILRFNQHPDCPIEESKSFNDNIKLIMENAEIKVKLQRSPGKDIKGSCGQFLV